AVTHRYVIVASITASTAATPHATPYVALVVDADRIPSTNSGAARLAIFAVLRQRPTGAPGAPGARNVGARLNLRFKSDAAWPVACIERIIKYTGRANNDIFLNDDRYFVARLDI